MLYGNEKALSGLPVDVKFFSFDDIINDNIPDVDVIINMGDAMTAYSGGNYWLNTKVITFVRKFVANGGGLIGVGEPSAIYRNGSYFQLSDVYGVEREQGQGLIFERYNWEEKDDFCKKDLTSKVDFGEHLSNIYAKDFSNVLFKENGQIQMAVNKFGQGKAYYLTGMKYNPENTRMLYRAMLSSCGKEDLLYKWYSSNPNCECTYFEGTGYCAVYNNTEKEQTTILYDGSSNQKQIKLKPMEVVWVKE